jgi:hypothetical protein
MFKYGLFMLLHVETQASFAHILNEKMRDTMEELGVGSMPNLSVQFQANQMAEVTTKVEREVTLDALDKMDGSDDEDDHCSGFEEVFVRAAESIELDHDFAAEIRQKREEEKERMMRDV